MHVQDSHVPSFNVDNSRLISTLSKTAPARTMRLIVAAHAFSGYDTVSGTFGIGKTKLIKLLEDVKLGATLEPHIEVSTQYNSIPDLYSAQDQRCCLCCTVGVAQIFV